MGHLLGKVLTTVEATTPTKEQANAIKDLMRGHFSDEMDFVTGMLYNQESLTAIAEDALLDLPDDKITSVSIEGALGVK